MTNVDLDELLHLESRFQTAGIDAGIRDGERLGEVEGRALGRQKGLEVGLELGYYTAFARYWTGQVAEASDRFSSRAAKQLTMLQSAIEEFPTENQLGVDALAMLDKIRTRFKMAASALGVGKRQQYSMPTDTTATALSY